jgi:hypothetical protein
VDRQSRGLATEVPQRDVHRPDGANGGRTIALPEQLPQPLAVERILAEDQRLEEPDQRLGVHGRAPHRRAEEGMTLQPRVGAQREQTEIAGSAEAARVPSVRGRRDPAPGEQGQGDVGDLHAAASTLFTAPA